MSEEHRPKPRGGFKMVLAVITAVHLLGLAGFLMLSLHPPKRADQELVWVNPGSFGGSIPGKIDAAPAMSVAPSAAPLRPAVENDEPPDAAPVTAPAGPEDAQASVSTTPAPATPVAAPDLRIPETPPPLPPLPAPTSDLTFATPSPPRATPAPTPKPAPVPTPVPAPKPVSKPRPKPSPSSTPKVHTTPKPSVKPKPSPKPAPERSPETAPSAKPPAGARTGTIAKNGDKAHRAERVDKGDDGTAGHAGATGEGSGTGSGQATGTGNGNGENKLAYYAELIKNRFQAAWNQPHGEITAGTELVATVRLRIQPDGSVTEFSLVEGSGNSVVDESVREAGRKITRLPPPPGGNVFNPVVRFELGD
ncbi:MAG: TonB C-terminal domain-containing protein [Verrucomicrobia bacterium]|nr:TonB C-terminal domain-containing protein [Verrucomicrobiota bacterium]